ncbi:MAG: GxxExxY protein [Akkermansiaceae bacterium]
MIYKQEAYDIIGAAMEVYRDKGHGFAEPVYQECMEIELSHCGVPFHAQQEFSLSYRGQPLKHAYIPDLICHEQIVVELKAVKDLADEHRAQVLNYLKATGCRLGLLINFGHNPGLQWERLIL